jgi:hypothetical protein
VTKPKTTPKISQQAGLGLAGPSVVAAAKKLSLPKPELLDFGESIFFLA